MGAARMTQYPLVNATIFAGLGVAIFLAAFAAAIKLLPFDLRKEIVQERNVPAAVLAGAMALGLAWIVAAAMH